MKPNKDIRIRFNTDYRDSFDFASRARLLQSIWRTDKNFDFEKYGNFLEEDFAIESGANFLTKSIFEIVKHEVQNKNIDGKVIKEPRIWNNLLSSQPLAFNLFGELKLNSLLASNVFKDLFPDRHIKQVVNIEFEYSPGREDPNYTGDKSALDVFIEYASNNDETGFFGIEVKYAEDLDDPPSSHKKKYELISKQSKIFDMSKIDELMDKPIQQIWRDHLLTLSLFITNHDYHIGDFIYLYPRGNSKCVDAIEQYKATFVSLIENHFIPLTIEKVIKTIKENCDEKWAIEFEKRYLDFSPIEELTI